jgi:hypothetical protein
VNGENGGGDASQLRGAVNLGVVQIETSRDATSGDGLAQTIEKRIKTLVGIVLCKRNETAGVVERSLEKDLTHAAIGARDPESIQHVGLSDLIDQKGFVLLVGGGGFVAKQLVCGESFGFQEAVESGSRDGVCLGASRMAAR